MRGQSLYDYCMEHEDKRYLLDEWDYDKNKKEFGISPKDVARAIHKKVWWKCTVCNNSWLSLSSSRVFGRGCPVCAKEKQGISRSKTVAKMGNDFASNYPELLVEWDYNRNNIQPSEISKGSNRKVWWICRVCGNQYEYRVSDKIRCASLGCSKCNKETKSSFAEQVIYYYLKHVYKEVINGSKAVLGNNWELDIYIPKIKTAIEYDGVSWHKNIERDLNKNKLCRDKGIKLIRIREKGLLDIEGSINIFRKDNSSESDLEEVLKELFYYLGIVVDVNIERDRQLIYSQYIQSKKENSLAEKFPEIAKAWHPTKNGALTPENVSYASKKKVWWLCDKGHEWEATVNSRSKGTECPYCSGHRVLKGFNDLCTTHPELIKEWHSSKNGDLTPDKISKGSGKKVWWKCVVCGKEWFAHVYSRTKGSGCPECAKRNMSIFRSKKASLNGNDLDSNYPDLLKEWDYSKNEINPHEIGKGYDKKVWWKCVTCEHEWYAHVYSRTKGHGCPECGKKKCVESRRRNRENKALQ